MLGGLQGLSLHLDSKRKWILVFALASILVGVSGSYAIGTAYAQFGEFADLPKRDAVGEYHCSVATTPPGGAWYGTCIDPADTAFMYAAASFVMIMTPGGVGFLYGGLTRRKNALTVILQNFLVYAIVSIQWVVWGYSLTFGPAAGGSHFIGNLDYALLNNRSEERRVGKECRL